VSIAKANAHIDIAALLKTKTREMHCAAKAIASDGGHTSKA
jgi:hypothetical protein